MESIDNEMERYAFYQKPNGYHFYRREETEDGVKETPVFSNYSGAVLHNREVITDTYDVETPSQDMRRALGYIEEQADKLREHGEESQEFQKAAEAFNAHVQLLDEREESIVLTVMEYVANSEDFKPDLEVIQELVEWGEVPEDAKVQPQGEPEEETETVDIDQDEDEDDDDGFEEGEVIDID